MASWRILFKTVLLPSRIRSCFRYLLASGFNPNAAFCIGFVSRPCFDVEGLEAGRPVTVLPTRFCGRCRACEQGHSNVCYNMDFIGLDSPGALQELWNVPADLVVPLDESVDLRAAALTEPAVQHA